MRVFSTKYPNVVANFEGHTYYFQDGACEMPEGVAVKFTQSNPSYKIDKESIPVSNFLHFDPASWKDSKKIIWDGPIGYNNGYGKASMMAIEGVAKHSDLYVVNSHWIGSLSVFLRPELEKIMERSTDKIDAFYIKFFPAFEFTERVAQRYIGYTMLECSKIPQSWVNNINRNCERVIVPSEHQKKAFEDSGVKTDVKVIPLGLIPEMFPYLEPNTDSDLVFGTMGTLTYRKGTDLLVKAFLTAFPKAKYPNVKLVLKQLGPLNWFLDRDTLMNDGRIMLLTESMSPEDLIKKFFSSIDCFVFPTHGEGMGLPVMEAMACGKPVIVTDYSAPHEFINDKIAYPLNYKEVLVPPNDKGGYPIELQADGQMWADADLDHLIALMLEVYNNRAKANAKGKKAAAYIRKNLNVDLMGKRLVEYLDSKF